MKLNENHMKLLSFLRKNSRQSFADINKITKIPTSTLFDYYWFLRKHEIIIKNSSLIDFKKLNYSMRVFVFIKVHKKTKLLKFLNECNNINSISKLKKFDFSFEIFFKSLEDSENFFEKINNFEIIKLQKYDVLENVMQEEFSFSAAC